MSALRKVEGQELLRAGSLSSWVTPFVVGLSGTPLPPPWVSSPRPWSQWGLHHSAVARPWVCAGRKILEAEFC